MLAVIAGALAVFCLGLAAVLARRDSRAGFQAAIAAAIVLAIVGAGIAVAGAIRWRGCFHASGNRVIRATGGFDENGDPDFEACPERALFVRDPLD
jgi:uncharacterized membrane protein YidH (DUF202 family)